jgi:hypothetical protein
MSEKVIKEDAAHSDKEWPTYKRPFPAYSHDPHGIEGQHQDTRLYSGLEAPPAFESKLLEDQRAAQGFPLTHKEIDTDIRFYDAQDVQRSCPSV